MSCTHLLVFHLWLLTINCFAISYSFPSQGFLGIAFYSLWKTEISYYKYHFKTKYLWLFNHSYLTRHI